MKLDQKISKNGIWLASAVFVLALSLFAIVGNGCGGSGGGGGGGGGGNNNLAGTPQLCFDGSASVAITCLTPAQVGALRAEGAPVVVDPVDIDGDSITDIFICESGDEDGDSLADVLDNDDDDDGVADAVDPDQDFWTEDEWPEADLSNCGLAVPAGVNTDTDDDGVGDGCECEAFEQHGQDDGDVDDDTIPDSEDTDNDDDTVPDNVDTDDDGDGIDDDLDIDDDNDGVPDLLDSI